MLTRANFMMPGKLYPENFQGTEIKSVDQAIYNMEIEVKDADRRLEFKGLPGFPGDWRRMHKLRCQENRIEYARGSATRRRIDGVDSSGNL